MGIKEIILTAIWLFALLTLTTCYYTNDNKRMMLAEMQIIDNVGFAVSGKILIICAVKSIHTEDQQKWNIGMELVQTIISKNTVGENNMDLATYEQINPWCENAGIKFFTPNQHCAWRIKTLLTKEPDTIAWIDSMPTDSIFIDVGANIGQYSLYAAKHGLTVHAFEPESQNFALLCRNIILNDFGNRITAYPVCVSNEAKLAILHLSSLTIGGSCHAFDKPLNYHGVAKEWPARQGSISITLDDFISDLIQSDIPNIKPIHLKVDVDGFEHLVIHGCGYMLDNIRSCLIEINTHYPKHIHLIEFMLSNGFHYDESQVQAARRTEGPFEGVGNIIFYRQ